MAKFEIIEGINTARIEWCCEQYRVGKSELARKTGIPLGKVESGRLTFKQLKKVADYFGHGALFFLEDDLPDAEKVHTPAFRTLAGGDHKLSLETSKIVRILEKHRDFFLGLLEEDEAFSELKAPEFTGKSIEEKANEAREWLQLEGINTNKNFDVYRDTIERKGIFVVRSNAHKGSWKIEDENIEGLSISDDKMPIIFVRKTSDTRQSFTLFHELGHLLLHRRQAARIDFRKNLSANANINIENEANQFASFCLLPRHELEAVYSDIPDNPSHYSSAFDELSKNFCLSIEAILVRLLAEGRIRNADYVSFKTIRREAAQRQTDNKHEGGGRRYRYIEPVRIFGKRYVNTVLDALEKEEITSKRATSYLDEIKIKTLNELASYALRN